MPFVQSGLTTVHYEAQGAGEALIFLHSLGTSLRLWDKQISCFRDRYLTVAIDARGHGKTGYSPPFAFADCAEDVILVMDKLGIERAHIVGESMGGYTIFELYSRIPERIISLSLCNTLYEFTAEMREERMNSRLAMVDRPDFVIRWAENSVHPAAPQDLIQETAALFGCTREVYKDGWIAINHINYTGVLPTITAPALVVTGDMDKIAPVEAAEDMNRKIKGSQLAIIASAGHLSNLSQPDEFNRILEAFLAKV